MTIIGYDEAKNYTEDQLRAMGFSPVSGIGWMDNGTAIGLGAATFSGGDPHSLAYSGEFNIDNLNRLGSERATEIFNQDYSPGGAFYNAPMTNTQAISSPSSTPTSNPPDDSGTWSWVKDAASGVGNWVKDHAGALIGGALGLGIASPSGAALLSKAGANYDNRNDDVNTGVDTALTDYFAPIDAAERNYKIDNPSIGGTGTIASVDQMSNMLGIDPTQSIDFGLAGTPEQRITSSTIPDVNINTNPSFTNQTITPEYGSTFATPTADITKNISDSINIAKPVIGSPLNDTQAPAETSAIDFGLKKTDTGNYFNSGTIADAIKRNPLRNTPVDYGNIVSNINSNQQSTIPQSPAEVIADLSVNGPVPDPINPPTVTPTVTPDVTPTVTPATTTPTTTGSSVGELPGFRKQLNQALGDAKRAAIMRGTPLSQNEIGGAVEGLAAGSYDRLRGAESAQMDKEKLSILKDQIATAKDQWERGFASENAYRDKVLELEKYYADKGLEIDMDLIDQNDKNADQGQLLGAAYLLSDLFWG